MDQAALVCPGLWQYLLAEALNASQKHKHSFSPMSTHTQAYALAYVAAHSCSHWTTGPSHRIAAWVGFFILFY